MIEWSGGNSPVLATIGCGIQDPMERVFFAK